MGVSATPPQLFTQQKSNTTETKYYGLTRDGALSDLTSADNALNEVLKDIQDPSEAQTLGAFTFTDLQIIEAITSFNLKKEDFEILKGSSISANISSDDEGGERSIPFINPRQRLSDRIKQLEVLAGRGTIYQGQGTTLFKYAVPLDSEFNHSNPPPFYTEDLGDSFIENGPDFIPTTPGEINSTHRVGFVQNGEFVPSQDPEWWWNGEYNQEFRDRVIYGRNNSTALDDPTFPIVRDGNLQFSVIFPSGINSFYNWGLRFDTWFKKSDFGDNQNFMRWAAQVNGHVRIDYFDRTGYSSSGEVEGSWKVAIDTTNPFSYYSQLEKEFSTQSKWGARLHYIQGGPSTPLGGGTGTLPDQRTPEQGGALDLSSIFPGREGEDRSKFIDEYVPVVIRFWYGKPAPNAQGDIASAPSGQASLVLTTIDSSISSQDLSLWNDYSAEVKLTYNLLTSAWETTGNEANFLNFDSTFEVIAHGQVGGSRPSSISNYIPTPNSTPIIATKLSPSNSVTRIQFSIPGIVPENNEDELWVVLKNRPWNTVRGGNRIVTSLWQRYLFHPNPLGKYRTSNDLLDGIGANYVEPDPKFSSFETNPDYYKAKYGQLPELNTYTQSRYDGMLSNSISDSSSSPRDYDYLHEKLLLIGRQKKDENVKPLQPGEVRKKAENYTFIEVVKNAAGKGGNVVINAYPTNNLSVLSTGVSSEQFNKFLHMGDNKETFTEDSRQNINFVKELLPSNTNFPTTARVRYEEINGNGRLVYGTWNESTFTPDNSGIIANLSLGAPDGVRRHNIRSAFLTDFTKPNGDEYSFYGMIGVIRDSRELETIFVNSGNTSITSINLFSNDDDVSNNQKYIGTEIIFGGSSAVHRVTAYNALTQTVTFTPSKPAGSYSNCEVWYNHLSTSNPLPLKIIKSSDGEEIGRIPDVLSVGDYAQISLVFNSAYQFTRVDNGAGLSFSETLYIKGAESPSPAAPFTLDTELPAPPADIVIPFGYDNSPSSSQPGLGGLCYPPYTVQNVLLQEKLSVSDQILYSAPVGQYDTWWGSKSNEVDLDGRSLTITSKLLFDFNETDRGVLFSTVSTDDEKRSFTGSEYTHKLEVELNVGLPSAPIENIHILKDAKFYSNNKPVKDRYYVFINKNGSDLEVLSLIAPNLSPPPSGAPGPEPGEGPKPGSDPLPGSDGEINDPDTGPIEPEPEPSEPVEGNLADTATITATTNDSDTSLLNTGAISPNGSRESYLIL